ncbi:hypothetical protein [Ruegeria marina]|uniref:Asp/Glu/hydantoin racemase n=1 Tax=Ruegeria marina TaxID=639004 RepID=A0A1G6ZWI3_9RHOB|nr:hypothetical protein [Ruegeria marina]SDE05976.1 hypothetical protein SAMN04488239_11397 [Ruegeria marina]
MTQLTLFHTAEAHRATFDTLTARIAPDARLTHVVRPDWLARAQGGIDDDLRTEITKTIEAVPGCLCTCTTIGTVAGAAGAVRIDWPMMQAAARSGGVVLLVFCLESTRIPSSDLLEEAFGQEGRPPRYHTLALQDLWPMYTAGDKDRFAQAIGSRIDSELALLPDIACVVLAQASMADAAGFSRAGVPVLSSPELALKAALGLKAC